MFNNQKKNFTIIVGGDQYSVRAPTQDIAVCAFRKKTGSAAFVEVKTNEKRQSQYCDLTKVNGGMKAFHKFCKGNIIVDNCLDSVKKVN